MLLVAADPFELQGIALRNGWDAVAGGGPGPRIVAEAVAGRHADIVVSTGICGGLDPSLRVGDIFVAHTVNERPALLPRTKRAFRSGALVSIDRVAQTAEEKAELFASGAMAVEMEAAAVAEFAAQCGARFYCIRAVSDVAGESFEVDLNAARGADGRFRTSRIVGQALRRPFRRVPELLRLRRNAQAAARALGEFFADCDF